MTKILLVEDDKSLREIYGVRLLAEGYDIVSAGDGEEALAMAIKERPRLILSDVMMPKISGFDMLDILRSTTETKDVKVIIMTALSSEDQRKRGEQLGADKYLVKSQVGIEDVVRAVHETLGDLPGVGTNPVPVSQPAHTYEPVAPEPQPTQIPAPQPVTRPDISSLSPQPAAPAATPTTPAVNPLIQQHPQQAFAPAPQPLPQPTPAAPQPIPTPQPTTLPQPMAPFSSPAPRPSGLGDRIIQPLPADDSQNSVDISKLMAEELDNTQRISQPTPEPQPTQIPAPQPTPNPIEQASVIPQVQAQPQEQSIPHQPSETSQSPQFPPINPQQ
ncbi:MULTISPECIES: response regulator transcription factor [unclassified Candidatus Nanosynbacter]|jgi:PAS/PAC sensor hybrid histidine kinase|uniref:response regulator transcription factor n=1 Tax=unclassified Candidatus Nanosynbacter TaxID=2725944 RepID=UPI00101C20C7|nr:MULTISPECIES: response regulator [unclassified Candidatus Nanosynbacter]MCJ1963186.1 response regulator [Candidatus Nanosynbacter sp. TM7-033]UOG67675.1 response regulator [Candidatus Nanosynbacter sp. HMT-352]